MFGALPRSGHGPSIPASGGILWGPALRAVTAYGTVFGESPGTFAPSQGRIFSYVNAHAVNAIVCRKPFIVAYTIQEYPTQLGIPAIFTVLYPEKEGCFLVQRKAEGHVLLEPGGSCPPFGCWCLSFPTTSASWWL